MLRALEGLEDIWPLDFYDTLRQLRQHTSVWDG